MLKGQENTHKKNNTRQDSLAYKETQSIRVSDFRDFVCSLFPKAIHLDFILKQIAS